MADNIMKLGLVLSATDKMSRVVDQATAKSTQSMKNFEKQAQKIGKTVQKIGAGITAAGGAITGALFADVENIANKAKEIQFSSQKIGLTTDEFQKLAFAAKKSGMEIAGFEVGMGKFAKTQVEAAKGSKEAIEKFKMAGIAIYDATGNLKKSPQILKELADKFKSAPDGAKKTALAMMIFGKSGKDMIPMLNKGGAELDKLGEKLKKSGSLLSKESIDSFKKYRGAIADSKLVLEGLKTQIAVAVLPQAIKMAKKIADITEKMGGWINKHKTLFTAIITTAASIGVILTVAGTFLMTVGTLVRSISLAIKVFNAIKFAIFAVKYQIYILNGTLKSFAIAQKVATLNQMLLNSSLGMGLLPLTLIVAAIAAVGYAVYMCWNKFAGFRAVIKTVWETVKGFGGILKDYVMDRIKGIIDGLGAMGRAISALFKGNFKEAGTEALKGVKALSGYDAKMKAVNKTKDLISGTTKTYSTILKKEEVAQKQTERAKPAMQRNTATNTSNLSKSVNATQVNYNPTINVAGATAADKESFAQMLRKHKAEIAKMVQEINANKQRTSFA